MKNIQKPDKCPVCKTPDDLRYPRCLHCAKCGYRHCTDAEDIRNSVIGKKLTRIFSSLAILVANITMIGKMLYLTWLPTLAQALMLVYPEIIIILLSAWLFIKA
jgi:hypothetical protein